MERLMTIDEVAEYLRVPVLTVRWLRQEGRFSPAVKGALPPVRGHGG